MTDITREQPASIKADGDTWALVIHYTKAVYPPDEPVTALVLADMHARRAAGIGRYGTPLQPHNGRDSLADAYQKQLDAAANLANWLVKQGVDMQRMTAVMVGDEDAPRWDTYQAAIKTQAQSQVFALFVDSVARLALVRELIEAERQGITL